MKNYNVKAHISYDVCSTISAESAEDAKKIIKTTNTKRNQ